MSFQLSGQTGLFLAVLKISEILQLGVIQQLRGPNFTQFKPNPLLEWTIAVILSDTYPLSRDQVWTFYCPPPSPFFSPRSY